MQGHNLKRTDGGKLPWVNGPVTTLTARTDRHRHVVFLDTSLRSTTGAVLAIGIDKYGKGVTGGLVHGTIKKDKIPQELESFTGVDPARWCEVDRVEGLTMAAGAIMASTVAGNKLPPALERGRTLFPQLDEVLLATGDIYTCPACDRALPPLMQVLCMEKIRQNVTGLLVFCPACRPQCPDLPSPHQNPALDEHYLRALMLTGAGQHHHALYQVNLAIKKITGRVSAEGNCGEHPLYYRLKGLILFRLNLPHEGAVYLERVRELETGNYGSRAPSPENSLLRVLATTPSQLLHPEAAALAGL